ncbi:MAG: methyltransferase [Phenylobacterium zucineum]|nr:MAG: methyltransferase [Phenylobacterium zucineum]
MTVMTSISRRALLAGALILAGCRSGDGRARGPMSLGQAIAGSWRTGDDQVRDIWRHPLESLQFWGLRPGFTVVEFWPGAGWYTDIIAPYLASNGGKLYAAHFQTHDLEDPAVTQIMKVYLQKLQRDPDLYGPVEVTAFGSTSGPVAPKESADLALFLRNLHNWMAAGMAEKAFQDAFDALKPGGVLGVEEHRAVPGSTPDILVSDGYVLESLVVQIGLEVGFQLEASSQINANPLDTKDHPFGVWTLPPVRRSSPRGQPPDPTFDHRRYDAIGESDRMTLRFRKPL